MRNLFLFCFCLVIKHVAFGFDIHIPIDTAIVSENTITIQGQKIDYEATTGMQPVWDAEGKVIASLHYTYYKKKGVKDMSRRPLLISFNGGPGSASCWMHIAYSGPVLLEIDEEGNPIQPYGIKDNPHSVLDETDILYVNPVNTGFSRVITAEGEKVDRDKFFGINADINYLSDWLNTFVQRHNRWLSPKYLIGESYGGTRVSGLAHVLQSKQWMYLNGVILVSPADYLTFESDTPLASALNFPYFAAAAWYHKTLSSELQNMSLDSLLNEVENFTVNQLVSELMKGGFIEEKNRKELAKKMSYYSGLGMDFILDHNLDIPKSAFWKELLRKNEGKTIGRLDSRYKGLDKRNEGSSPDYNVELTNWLHSFTPAINYYMREVLGFKTDLKYNVFGPVYPWDKRNNNTRDDLRKAMAQNPYLNVFFQVGYFDGATTYFHSKYTMWQLDPSGKMKSRMHFTGYESGHMMYLREVDLKRANDDLRAFIRSTFKENGVAKYD